MKNYQSSDYAANKYARGIVYRLADTTVEVKMEEYLRENPGKTKADFAELKALSDEIFFEQDRNEGRQRKKMVSFHALEETDLLAVPSPEETMIATEEQVEKQKFRREIAAKTLSVLTDVQRRRYLLHTVNGMTTRAIAEKDGVSHVAVVYSLEQAEKKIKKVLTSD
ncbi:MAG TPA: RNA polymerase subunit sigma-24 [Clostridia bacterium]|nr:RNA polymerase subunit sigma-24 [Clostridia bacterium]